MINIQKAESLSERQTVFPLTVNDWKHGVKVTSARRPSRLLTLAAFALASSFALSTASIAQNFSDLKIPETPLVLKGLGSFYIPGELQPRSPVDAGVETADVKAVDSQMPAEDNMPIGQMYVQYMLPMDSDKVPVMLLHGGSMTGKNFETQPDGRMGWGEYFVRKGFPIYIGDQINRARSGFDPAIFNRVRTGEAKPTDLPPMVRSPSKMMWPSFRIGPQNGKAYEGSQFPVEHYEQFAQQLVPEVGFPLGMTAPGKADPSAIAMARFSKDAGGVVLAAHSEAGAFPFDAALISPETVKGAIALEPAFACNNHVYNDSQINTLARVPILVVWGDYLGGEGGQDYPGALEACNTFADRVNKAGGNAKVIHLPEIGITGNGHMLFNDKNSDRVADVVIEWIEQNVK